MSYRVKVSFFSQRLTNMYGAYFKIYIIEL